MSSTGLRQWLGGIISASASGLLAALTTSWIAPNEFNLENPRKLIIVVVAQMAMSIAKFIVKRPLPTYRTPKLKTKRVGQMEQIVGVEDDGRFV